MIEVSRFSTRVRTLPGALSIYINELTYAIKRKGIDVITLSLGEAFFDVPLFDFSKLDVFKGFHYSDSQGLPELRAKIAQYYEKNYQCSFSFEKEILVTTGSKAAIFLAMIATVNAGEEVLIHEPAWLSYREHARLIDASVKFIPFDIQIADFGGFVRPNTRMLIINNPNNPAGRCYSKSELTHLIELCNANNIWLLVDEAYSDFVEPGTFHSAWKLDGAQRCVIVANSLSKNMGMSGLRIGYLIADQAVIAQVLKLNQHIITCAPTLLQSYLATYFEKIVDITVPQAREIVFKRAQVAEKFAQYGISVLPGSATFYFFVHIGDYPASSFELALYLLLFHQIACVPGSAYGTSTERYLRISIGTESPERIDQALIVLRGVLREPKVITDLIKQKLTALRLPVFQDGL